MKIKKWLKEKRKYFIVMLLYLMYQTKFIYTFLNNFNINIFDLSKPYRLIIDTIVSFIYIIIIMIMFKKEIKKGIKDLKENFVKRGFISVICWMLGILVMIISSTILNKLLGKSAATNELGIREALKRAPIYMFISCTIIAPIFEEMVFRISIKGIIKNNILFILTSGFVFGFIHITQDLVNVIQGTSSMFQLLYIIPYSSMGLALAYLYSKTKNITLPILVHFIHNTILVLIQII